MSRKWTLLTLIFFLGSSGALQANPLNSPGIVYIDGLPCNRACQSYMAWSRPSPAQHREVGETNVVVPAEVELERMEHAARQRVARQPLPVSRPLPPAGIAASNAKPSNAKPSNTKASHTNKVAAPKLAHQATRKAIPAATATVIPEKTVPGVQEPERKLESSDRVEPAQGASIAAAPPTESPKPEVAKSKVAKSEIAKSEIVKSEVAAPAPPSQNQPRQKLSRRLPRPRTQRCLLRLARLPLRRSGQYRSKL